MIRKISDKFGKGFNCYLKDRYIQVRHNNAYNLFVVMRYNSDYHGVIFSIPYYSKTIYSTSKDLINKLQNLENAKFKTNVEYNCFDDLVRYLRDEKYWLFSYKTGDGRIDFKEYKNFQEWFFEDKDTIYKEIAWLFDWESDAVYRRRLSDWEFVRTLHRERLFYCEYTDTLLKKINALDAKLRKLKNAESNLEQDLYKEASDLFQKSFIELVFHFNSSPGVSIKFCAEKKSEVDDFVYQLLGHHLTSV